MEIVLYSIIAPFITGLMSGMLIGSPYSTLLTRVGVICMGITFNHGLGYGTTVDYTFTIYVMTMLITALFMKTRKDELK